MNETFDFSQALTHIKTGRAVARKHWNGIEAGKKMKVLIQVPDTNSKMNTPYLYLTTGTDGEPTTVVPFVASQTDILADDWITV